MAAEKDIFDPERLLEVDIELEPADWASLSNQHHDFIDYFVTSCPGESPERPYDYFEARVTVDGETIDSVAVRKKGFLGSVTPLRPSLKLSFDEYVAGREFSGLRRMTLNNNHQDSSRINTCLTYRAFRAAGIPAPRCNHARVTVNGHYLGIYSHVESIKRPFLARNFADDSGNLYEGAFADFRPLWIDNYEAKPGNDADRGDLDALALALQAPEGELAAALEPILDVDAFLTYWAMELLVGDWDGYVANRNNHYLYRVPTTGQFQFIPWGPDATFGVPNLLWDFSPPASVWANAQLPQRLYANPESHDRYQQRLRELLDSTWNETDLHSEIDRLEALLAPHVALPDEMFEQSLGRVREFVDAQRELIEADLASDNWERTLPESYCLAPRGTMSGTFTTTFGELISEDPFGSGTATLDIVLDGAEPSFSMIGANSGPEEDVAQPRAGLSCFALGDEGVLIPFLLVDPALFQAGSTLVVDMYDVEGALLTATTADDVQLIGMTHGTLTLDQADATPDGAVSGSFELEILDIAAFQ